MPLVRPRFLVPWTSGLATISCHQGGVIKSKQHFGELTPMGRIVYTNVSFYHLV
jgi:hypothetical protein